LPGKKNPVTLLPILLAEYIVSQRPNYNQSLIASNHTTINSSLFRCSRYNHIIEEFLTIKYLHSPERSVPASNPTIALCGTHSRPCAPLS